MAYEGINHPPTFQETTPEFHALTSCVDAAWCGPPVVTHGNNTKGHGLVTPYGWPVTFGYRAPNREAFKKTLSRFDGLAHFHWMAAGDKSDESLTERLRSPDVKDFEAAFRELYAAEKALVYGLLLRLSGDAETAADLFQNVWLKLARHRQRLREDTVLRAWLCTVARNEYLNYRRAQVLDLARLLTIGREPSSAGAEPDPRLVDVNSALQRLADADREVLLLTSVDGLSPRQAAEAAGIREEALRQRLSRARRRLVIELERESPWSRLRAWLPLAKRRSHGP